MVLNNQAGTILRVESIDEVILEPSSCLKAHGECLERGADLCSIVLLDAASRDGAAVHLVQEFLDTSKIVGLGFDR